MEEELEEERPLNLDDYAAGSIPTLFYIPDFITQSEQFQLLHHIYQVPASRWKSLKNRRLQNWGGVVHERGLFPQDLPPWLTNITQRICQQTGLFPSCINHVLVNEYLPDQGIMPHQDGPAYFPVVAIISLGSPVVIDFTPHQRFKEAAFTDSNAEESAELKSTTMERDGLSNELTSAKSDDHPLSSFLLMPGSMLIFKDQAYSDYLHGIQDSKQHELDKVVNMSQCCKFEQLNYVSCADNSVEFTGPGQASNLHRTCTRVSLTFRFVLKVHKKLFKF